MIYAIVQLNAINTNGMLVIVTNWNSPANANYNGSSRILSNNRVRTCISPTIALMCHYLPLNQ